MIIPRDFVVATTNASTSVSSSMVCDEVHHCRTVPAIAINCASTMFLCTWVAFHPDVPEKPDDLWWQKFLRRIKFMAIALVAPEYVFWNSFWQWVNSADDGKRLLEGYPNCRLTETHYMFGRMGGFQIVSGRGKRQLRGYEFFVALRNGTIETPTMTEGEVQDKSKGDDIAKAITLVQTLWFAIQAANRVAQGFVVTELELTTLGHVVLNVLICWCWWKKPLNVDYPVEVHAKRDEKGVDATPQEGKERPVEMSGTNAYESQTPAPQSLPLRTRMGAYIYDLTWDGLTDSSLASSLFVIFSFSIIGGIFGAIHCLAWNSVFPTHAESILWRVAALVVTTIPGIIYTVYACHSSLEIRDTLKSPFVLPLTIIYCLASS